MNVKDYNKNPREQKNQEHGTEKPAGTYYYAYLNQNDVVEELYVLPMKLVDDRYVPIPSYDRALVGLRYQPKSKTFEEVRNQPDTAGNVKAEPPTPEEELLRAEAMDRPDKSGDVPRWMVKLQHVQETFAKAKMTKQFFFPFDYSQEGGLPRYVYIKVSSHSKFTNADTVILWLARSGENTSLYARYQEGTYPVRSTDSRFEGKPGFLHEKQANQNPAVFQQAIIGNQIQVKGGSAFVSRKDKKVVKKPRIAQIGRFTYDENGIGFEIGARYMRGTRLTAAFYIEAYGYC